MMTLRSINKRHAAMTYKNTNSKHSDTKIKQYSPQKEEEKHDPKISDKKGYELDG